MNADKERLAEAEKGLVESKKVLRAEKKKAKKLKGNKLEKENAGRRLETVKNGVKAIKQQRDALEEKRKAEKARR